MYKIIIIFIIVLSFIIFIYYYNNNNICTPNIILNKVRSLLYITHHILSSNNIIYFADGGTLLGAIRHNNVIPWDDDGDIVILDKYKDKFINLKNEFTKYNINIKEFWGGYRIYFNDGYNINHNNRNWQWTDNNVTEDFSYKYPFIDVFFMDEYDDIYDYSNNSVKSIYDKHYYKKNDLFPLKKHKFHDFYINIPNNPYIYLERVYGSDWNIYGYKEYDHQNMKFLDKKKFKISDINC